MTETLTDLFCGSGLGAHVAGNEPGWARARFHADLGMFFDRYEVTR